MSDAIYNLRPEPKHPIENEGQHYTSEGESLFAVSMEKIEHHTPIGCLPRISEQRNGTGVLVHDFYVCGIVLDDVRKGALPLGRS